jgi:hypothetical protein
MQDSYGIVPCHCDHFLGPAHSCPRSTPPALTGLSTAQLLVSVHTGMVSARPGTPLSGIKEQRHCQRRTF